MAKQSIYEWYESIKGSNLGIDYKPYATDDDPRGVGIVTYKPQTTPQRGEAAVRAKMAAKAQATQAQAQKNLAQAQRASAVTQSLLPGAGRTVLDKEAQTERDLVNKGLNRTTGRLAVEQVGNVLEDAGMYDRQSGQTADLSSLSTRQQEDLRRTVQQIAVQQARDSISAQTLKNASERVGQELERAEWSVENLRRNALRESGHAAELYGAKQRRNTMEQRQTELATQYYDAENRESAQRLQRDVRAKQLYDDAAQLDKDLEQLPVLQQMRNGGAGTQASEAELQRMAQAYGFTMDELQYNYGGVLERMQRRREQAVQQLADAGYDYARMADYAERQTEAERNARSEARWAQEAKEHPVASSLTSIATSAASGADFLRTTLGNRGGNDPAELESYVPYDTAGMRNTNYTQAVRGAVSEDMSSVASFLYNTGLSVAESVALAATLGSVAAPVMGLSAAANTMKNAVESGASNKQALTMALASGVAEMVFEKLSLGELLKPTTARTGKELILQILKQSGVDASEEMMTEAANILADVAILRGNGQMEQAYQAYLQSGMDAKEAGKRVVQDMVQQVGLAGLGGAISGGVSGGIFNAAGYAANRAQQPASVAEMAADALDAPKAQQTAQAAPYAPENPTVAEIAAGYEPAAAAQGQAAAPTQTQPAQNVSAEDSVGAAKSGFDKYSHAQLEYGTIPEGENPARTVDVPKSMDGETYIPRGVRSVMESAATSDEQVAILEQAIADGEYSRERQRNADYVARAEQRIQDNGVQNELTSWMSSVESGQMSEQLVADGASLLTKFRQDASIDKGLYVRFVADYSDLMSRMGRGTQMGRLIKRLTPEGQLIYLQQISNNINEEHKKSHANATGIEGVKINPDLATAFRDAKPGEQRDAAWDALLTDIAKQIPSSGLDKWTALRYTNMLGNLKTQDRNILGNIGMTSNQYVKNRIVAVLEAAANKISGGRVEVSRAFAYSPKLFNAAWQDFDAIADAAMSTKRYAEGSRQQIRRELDDRRTIFKIDGKWGTQENDAAIVKGARRVADAAMAGMEKYRKLTNWAMEVGDRVFSRFNYADSLGQLLAAKGYSAADMQNGRIPESELAQLRERAIHDAQEATFRDSNAVSDFAGSFDRNWGKAKVFSQGLMPFRSTPANVGVRMEEYSPVGIFNTAVKAAKAAKGGTDRLGRQITANDVIDQLAKTLTGTGLLFIGAVLRANGKLVGADDEDEKQQEIDELSGRQEYALEIDGASNTINWFTPTAMTLFMGVKAYESMAENGMGLQVLEDVLLSFGDAMLNMSMLESLNSALETAAWANEPIGAVALDMLENYLRQGFSNSLLGQLERTTEPYRQTTYIDKDSALPETVQYMLGGLSAKVPGWDYNQTDYIDPWGQKEYQGSVAERAAQNLLSPGYRSEINTDGLNGELQRLLDQTGQSIAPQEAEWSFLLDKDENGDRATLNLDAAQHERYAIAKGETYVRLLTDAMESGLYQTMSPEEQVDVAKALRSYADDYAKQQVTQEFHSDDKWAQSMIDEGATPEQVVQYVINKQVGGAFSEAMELAETDAAAGAAEIDRIFNAYEGLDEAQQTQLLEQVGGQLESYVAMRRAGLDAAQYVQVRGVYDAIEAQEDAGAVQKATEFAKWLDESGLNGRQKRVAKEQMKYWQIFPAEAERYETLTGAGMSADKSKAVYDAMAAREADTNAKKYDAINAAQGLSNEDKYLAARALLAGDDDTANARIDAAMMAGIDYGTWAKYYNAKEYYKEELGISVSSKAKYTELINGLGIEDRKTKQALWVIANLNHKPWTCPYGQSQESVELYNYLQEHKTVSQYE